MFPERRRSPPSGHAAPLDLHLGPKLLLLGRAAGLEAPRTQFGWALARHTYYLTGYSRWLSLSLTSERPSWPLLVTWIIDMSSYAAWKARCADLLSGAKDWFFGRSIVSCTLGRFCMIFIISSGHLGYIERVTSTVYIGLADEHESLSRF